MLPPQQNQGFEPDARRIAVIISDFPASAYRVPVGQAFQPVAIKEI
jgi:hypothetical protein